MEQQGQAAAPPAPTAQAPVSTAQAAMLSGISPHRMSLNTRPTLSAKEQAERYQRAHLIAALLTRIYGPEAERYFDEAFGTNLHDTNSTYSSSTRHPHEFQRMSSQISRSIGLARVPWDPLKHPRGRDGRFIEKYGIDAFTATQSQINATLDPNANPSRGRVSDDVRPLLEHLNILDHSQLHNLLSQYERSFGQSSTKTVAPDSLIHKVNYQLHGEDTQEDHEVTEEEHLDSNNDVNPESVQQDPPNDGVYTDQEEESETNDEASLEETESDSDEDNEGLIDEDEDEADEETRGGEDSEPQESTDQDYDDDTAENLEEESESDQEDDPDESENEDELVFGDPEATEPKYEITQTGRGGRQARLIEPPTEKVLSGVLASGGELFQSIADLPHDSFDGNKDSTRKIQKGRQQEQASVAVLTQLRDELYKTYSKYIGYQQARGTRLIPREKQLEIQHQLVQLFQLIGKVDTLIRSSRESEHNMYQQEKIASLREYKQAATAAPLGVEVVPAPVQPSLIQSDINYYSKEIALTIATAPLGGIVFRLAGKGLKALKALRAARAAKIAKAAAVKNAPILQNSVFTSSGNRIGNFLEDPAILNQIATQDVVYVTNLAEKTALKAALRTNPIVQARGKLPEVRYLHGYTDDVISAAARTLRGSKRVTKPVTILNRQRMHGHQVEVHVGRSNGPHIHIDRGGKSELYIKLSDPNWASKIPRAILKDPKFRDAIFKAAFYGL